MIAMTPVLALIAATTLGTADASTAAPSVPTWRLAGLAGPSWMQSERALWLGDRTRPSLGVRLERPLGASTALALDLGLLPAQANATLGLEMVEVRVACTYGWPSEGVWGLAHPYARLALDLASVVVRAGDAVDRAWVPGVEVGVGLRLSLPRRHRVSLFGFAEVLYAARLPRVYRLENDSDLGGPATRLGRLDVSGVDGRVGVGIAF